ncbi:unnamed protein product [Allacma fusca]|uniref:SCP domain-containing protein n=1 Tax=Allacma fusca TaxID=39272 RepID=A0A8J2LAG4_9HEXA|nr:unnamed protein product [Allacma fusca]
MKTGVVIVVNIFAHTIFGTCSQIIKNFVDIPGFVGMDEDFFLPEHSRPEREIAQSMTFEKMARTKVRTSRDWIDAILQEHNRLRDLHGVPALKLDEELCKTSQFWVEYLGRVSEGRTLPILFRKHWYEVGGNIWAAVGRKDANHISPTFAWYNEERYYTYGNDTYCGVETNKDNHHVDHFTQMIWQDSKTVGCAKYKNGSGHIYVVCHYQPPGNVRGAYNENVPKPVKLE